MDGVDANLKMVGTVASSTRNHRIPEPPELRGAVAPRKVERQRTAGQGYTGNCSWAIPIVLQVIPSCQVVFGS